MCPGQLTFDLDGPDAGSHAQLVLHPAHDLLVVVAPESRKIEISFFFNLKFAYKYVLVLVYPICLPIVFIFKPSIKSK